MTHPHDGGARSGDDALEKRVAYPYEELGSPPGGLGLLPTASEATALEPTATFRGEMSDIRVCRHDDDHSLLPHGVVYVCVASDGRFFVEQRDGATSTPVAGPFVDMGQAIEAAKRGPTRRDLRRVTG